MTGVIPRRPKVWDHGDLIDRPHSSSNTIQPPTAAAVLLSAAMSVSSHTSSAPSSRSMARHAPSWQVQPQRRTRKQMPEDGVLHLEFPKLQCTEHLRDEPPSARMLGCTEPDHAALASTDSRQRRFSYPIFYPNRQPARGRRSRGQNHY